MKKLLLSLVLCVSAVNFNSVYGMEIPEIACEIIDPILVEPLPINNLAAEIVDGTVKNIRQEQKLGYETFTVTIRKDRNGTKHLSVRRMNIKTGGSTSSRVVQLPLEAEEEFRMRSIFSDFPIVKCKNR